jgi:CubicO group peptidase (beta-lactamase class C family)
MGEMGARRDRGACNPGGGAIADAAAAGEHDCSRDARAHDLDKADVDAWLDGYMPYALKAGGIPGAVVVVVKDGQPLTMRGFGYADVKARTPVDPQNTLFRPGSVSKLFTWTAVMQQVQAGKINLDADVNTYLDFKIPPYHGKPITVRNLMTHTPGFAETAKYLILYGKKAPVPLKQALLRSIRSGSTSPERCRPIPISAHRSPATLSSGCRASLSSNMCSGTSSRRSEWITRHSSSRYPPISIA